MTSYWRAANSDSRVSSAKFATRSPPKSSRTSLPNFGKHSIRLRFAFSRLILRAQASVVLSRVFHSRRQIRVLTELAHHVETGLFSDEFWQRFLLACRPGSFSAACPQILN